MRTPRVAIVLLIVLIDVGCIVYAQEITGETHTEGPYTFQDLLTGTPGRGTLVLSKQSGSPPIVVTISNDIYAGYTAQIYDNGVNQQNPVSLGEGGQVASGNIAITIRNHNKWWIQDGTPSYDLDIVVYSPSLIWTAPFHAWTIHDVEDAFGHGHALYEIIVRNVDQFTIPQVELVQSLPNATNREVPNIDSMSFIRTGYSERKCPFPVEYENVASEYFPYIAASDDGFEQAPGRFSPPVKVDWSAGKVLFVGEFVTMRVQPCEYHFSSIQRWTEGSSVNQSDFESPFAFYNFGSERAVLPNLLIRSEYFFANDKWGRGMAPGVLHSAVGNPVEMIRYSWSTKEEGDWTWDYKLDMTGTYSYASTIELPIEGYTVEAPSYEQFPEWVIDKEWPVMAFVDTTANLPASRSSEGIYTWPTRLSLDPAYWLGYSDSVRIIDSETGGLLRKFETIERGWRGEYVIGRPIKPQFYLSSIDNQVHLLGATDGLWNLGDGWQVRTANLIDDPYLDSWALTKTSEEERIGQELSTGTATELSITESAVYVHVLQLGGYLVEVSNGALRIRRGPSERAAVTIAPPTDRPTWQAFQRAVKDFEEDKRDPFDMKSWLDVFEGPTLELGQVSVRTIEPSADGKALHFVLNVQEGASLSGELSLSAFDGLAPGDYVLTYSRDEDSWRRVTATPPRVVAFIEATELEAFQPGELALTLVNSGTVPWRGDVGLRIGKTDVHTWSQTSIAGETSLVKSLTWSPDSFGELPVTLLLDGQEYRLDTAAIVRRPRIQGLGSFALSLDEGSSVPVVAALLGLCLLFGCASLWIMWRRA